MHYGGPRKAFEFIKFQDLGFTYYLDLFHTSIFTLFIMILNVLNIPPNFKYLLYQLLFFRFDIYIYNCQSIKTTLLTVFDVMTAETFYFDK